MAGVEAAGRVANEDPGAVPEGFLVGGIADRSRVGIGGAFHERQIEPLGPAFELFHGGGAEGIGRCKNDRDTVPGEEVAELGTGSGLAGAVHAHHQDHVRPAVVVELEGVIVIGKRLGDALPGGFHHVVGRHLASHPLEVIDDLHGEAHSQIGRDEIRFEFVPVDLGLVGNLVVEVLEEASHGEETMCGDRGVGPGWWRETATRAGRVSKSGGEARVFARRGFTLRDSPGRPAAGYRLCSALRSLPGKSVVTDWVPRSRKRRAVVASLTVQTWC